MSFRLPRYSAADVAQQLATGMSAGVHLGTRRIFLTGEVDTEMAARFMVAFRCLDATKGEIYITLDSEGGSMDQGFAIYDTIRLSNNAVIVDVVGNAQSIAALILQAGDVRRATPEARIMIHQGKLYTGQEAFAADDLKEQGRELAYSNQRYYRALSEKSKLPVKEVVKLCKKDTYFSSAEAKQHGLIDIVIAPAKRVVFSKTSLKVLPRAKKNQKKKDGKK
jgi:ATP-dependent Clp protease protease subunit